MYDLYKKLRTMLYQCSGIVIYIIVRLLEMVFIRMRMQAKKQMWNAELDAIPLVSNKSLHSSIQGRYCLSEGIRYRYTGSGIKLITLHLSTFERQDRTINPGEDIYIPPYMVHAFLKESDNNETVCIKKTSGNSWNYSFEIDNESEYTGVSDNFSLDQRKMRIVEALLRLEIVRNADKGLTYDLYHLILHDVYHLSLFMKLSGFEHSLLLGMAFDFMQRLGVGKIVLALSLSALTSVYIHLRETVTMMFRLLISGVMPTCLQLMNTELTLEKTEKSQFLTSILEETSRLDLEQSSRLDLAYQ